MIQHGRLFVLSVTLTHKSLSGRCANITVTELELTAEIMS